jgi:hypothetical protein
MRVFRVLGIFLIVLGLIFCATIIGAHVGVTMIIVGAILIWVSKQ